MKRLSQLILLVLISVVMVSCGGSKKAKNQTKLDGVPEWYLNTPNDPNYIISVGTAISRDLQMAVNTATEEARVSVARELETKVSGMFKKFSEEVGTGADSEYLQHVTNVSKSVVSTTLSGTKVRKKEIIQEGGGIRAYVLMEMAIGPMKEALLNKVKQQKNMYTRFRSAQSFKELENEVEKFDKFKESNGGY